MSTLDKAYTMIVRALEVLESNGYYVVGFEEEEEMQYFAPLSGPKEIAKELLEYEMTVLVLRTQAVRGARILIIPENGYECLSDYSLDLDEILTKVYEEVADEHRI